MVQRMISLSLIFALGFLSGCSLDAVFDTGKDDPSKNETSGSSKDQNQGNNGDNENGEDDEDGEEHERGSGEDVTYTFKDLIAALKRVESRFGKTVEGTTEVSLIRSWVEGAYVWARLVYVSLDSSGNKGEETSIILACHPHGDKLGCHVKKEAGPGEPVDVPSDDDEELPDLEDEF